MIGCTTAAAARGGQRAAVRTAITIAALGVASLLSACGGGSPPDTFDLSAPTSGYTSRAPRGLLVISEPGASSPVDSDRIVIRTGSESVAYLKGSQWSDRLPRLIQTRLVQSFDNAHLMRSVARPQDGLSADYRLVSDIRRFEIDATTGEAVIQIAVKLVAEKSGRIVAGEIFNARAPGSAADGASASAALDVAMSSVLRQIVAWSASRV